MANKFSFERYIWFHSKLKAGRYPKLAGLAEKFEISGRQAAREIDFMKNFFSAPIEYSHERNGYYYSEAGFELPGIWLGQEEIVALIISKRISTAIPDQRLKKKIDFYFRKIAASTDFDFADLEKRVSLKNIHYYTVAPEIFASCAFALAKKRKMRIKYRSAYRDEINEREISPLHLLLYLGNWHLIAYCHSRNDLRDFVLSRVTEMEILANLVSEELLARDIKQMIDKHYGIFLQGEEKQVRVRFHGHSVGIVRDQLWFAGQQVTEDKDTLILSFPVTDYREVLGDILRFGADAEVLEPVEFRELIRETSARMAHIYQNTPSGRLKKVGV
jgi:predicted DNA-binding transcriptional regulator YafY